MTTTTGLIEAMLAAAKVGPESDSVVVGARLAAHLGITADHGEVIIMPMTRREVIAEAKAAGYTLIQTANRVLPLDQWTPYGATAKDERTWRRLAGWDFLSGADGGGPRIVDVGVEGTPGVWRLGRADHSEHSEASDDQTASDSQTESEAQ